MKFTLVTRAVSSTDVSPSCPCVPSADDIDMCLDGLADEIRNLAFVQSVTHDAFVFTIALSQPHNLTELEDALMPYFSDCFCQIRFVPPQTPK
jgi:hypothetical protein